MKDRTSTKRWLPTMIFLIVLVVMSALAVAYSSHLNRQSFIALKQAISLHTELEITQGKLLLEQSAWTSPAVIESYAENQLGMHVPNASQVVIVSPSPFVSPDSSLAVAPQPVQTNRTNARQAKRGIQ